MTAQKKKNNTKPKAKAAAAKGKGKGKPKGREEVRDPIRVELFAIGYIALALILLLVFVLFKPDDAMTGAGVIGVALSKFFGLLLGKARFCLPFFLLLLGWFYWKRRDEGFPFRRSVAAAIILFFAVLAVFAIFKPLSDLGVFLEGAQTHGGVIGNTLSWLLLKAFGTTVSIVILAVLTLGSLVAITGMSFFGILRKTGAAGKQASQQMGARVKERREERRLLAEEEANRPPPVVPVAEAEPEPLKIVLPPLAEDEIALAEGEMLDPDSGEIIAADEDEVAVREDYDVNFPGFGQYLAGKSGPPTIAGDDPNMGLSAGVAAALADEIVPAKAAAAPAAPPVIEMEEIEVPPAEPPFAAPPAETAETEDIPIAVDPPPERPYVLPKTDILKKGGRVNSKAINKNISESVEILENTLASFGVTARVTEVSYGPSITRFEVQPGPGVKVSKIVGLADDIALQLKSAGIRMEAPVPGKSVIGIEVPRTDTNAVSFRDILENSDFFELPSKLICAFGKDIAGAPVLGNLASMPHLLIAGATGSGKSVCMNTIICSLLFRAKPHEVKFIMVDPKRVEFAAYEGLPHLITPVVTDPKKAAGSLKWAVREMENRYALFNTNRVKNLEGYNALVTEEHDKLPQIVVFIDELADLMMIAAKDVEECICRLAQMARAAGIHLVIATQRPSVDVITGLIKANIPSRIAFAVSSQTDSRTILDMGGAEKLLGRGDMLYHPVGMAKPLRVQGAYLSEEEAEVLLEHCKKQGSPDYVEGVAQPVGTSDHQEGVEDELFFEAGKSVITAGQASASMLQRRFRIGYNRAARLMEVLQEKGVVGPADGARPRQVLMTLDSFLLSYPPPGAGDTLFDD